MAYTLNNTIMVDGRPYYWSYEPGIGRTYISSQPHVYPSVCPMFELNGGWGECAIKEFIHIYIQSFNRGVSQGRSNVATQIKSALGL